MATLVTIRKAKEVGVLIRKARMTSGLNIQSLATMTGLSVNQILHLENGNIYAFHESIDDLMEVAKNCGEKLDVRFEDSGGLLNTFNPKEAQFSIKDSIPVFIQKRA
jgi:transcriptional regulator with XRE-family HTH domain